VKRTQYAVVAMVLFALVAVMSFPESLAAQAQPKDTAILAKFKNPMGGVKFNHKMHSEMADVKCDTCHHASKEQMPAKSANQACSDCHSMPAKAPMKTNYQGAFHKPTGQTGLCVDCHKQSNAKGSKAPLKCTDCHKKENVAPK